MPNNGDVPLQRIDATANSWGYRVVVAADYSSLFGGVNMTPRAGLWSRRQRYHAGADGNVRRRAPPHALGVAFSYLERLEVDFALTLFSGGGDANQLRDRDYAQARFTYFFR